MACIQLKRTAFRVPFKESQAASPAAASVPGPEVWFGTTKHQYNTQQGAMTTIKQFLNKAPNNGTEN